MRIVSVPGYTKEHTHTCLKCKTVVAVIKDDVQYHSDQRDGSYVDFMCPTCQNRICIDINQLPFGFLL